jgi:hypothetical protein
MKTQAGKYLKTEIECPHFKQHKYLQHKLPTYLHCHQGDQIGRISPIDDSLPRAIVWKLL